LDTPDLVSGALP
jgi:hypothetical protein